jgi:hypothetical protein
VRDVLVRGLPSVTAPHDAKKRRTLTLMRYSRLCTYFVSVDKISLDICIRICLAFSSARNECTHVSDAWRRRTEQNVSCGTFLSLSPIGTLPQLVR